MLSPKLDPVILSDEERHVLVAWSRRRRRTAQALAARVPGVLLAALVALFARAETRLPGRF